MASHHHITVRHHPPKPHQAHKAKAPARKPHVHQTTRSHHVRIVHAHISVPRAVSNPYKVVIV